MCKCDPRKRTPWCGKEWCEIPEQVLAITDGPIVSENITIDARFKYEKRIKELEADRDAVQKQYFKKADENFKLRMAILNFKRPFEKGFPNSLDALEARDNLFEVLKALDV
jgi:hypothetical protein